MPILCARCGAKDRHGSEGLRDRFAAERLMEMEVDALTGASYGEKHPLRQAQRNGIATGTGRPGSGRRSCGSPNYGKAATSPAFWSHGAWPKGL